MKTLHFKSAVISAIIIQVIGVTAFVCSYFVPVLPNPDAQANWVLSLAIIPAAILGAHLYYRKGHQTSGLLLGLFMFLMAAVLDALLTVPLLVVPNGGSYAAFYSDPHFWLIAVEYVGVVAAYRHFLKMKPASGNA